MLIRRSAPQPLTMNTPTGGTRKLSVSHPAPQARSSGRPTQDGDEDQEDSCGGTHFEGWINALKV
jgi:hypothetical protein